MGRSRFVKKSLRARKPVRKSHSFDYQCIKARDALMELAMINESGNKRKEGEK